MSYRFWKVKSTLCLENKIWISLLQKIAQKFNELDLSKIEKIGGYARDPLISSAKVVIPDSKKEAITLAK